MISILNERFVIKWYLDPVQINPKRTKRGRNLSWAHLTACHFIWGEVRTIKPSCNFHFGCLEQVNDINFRGCIWKFSKILSFEKKIPSKMRRKFKKIFFCKFFHNQLYFFMTNLNLECFELSFDIHIVHVGQKLWIFKNCSTENQEISAVKVGYFGATLSQNCAT